MQDFLFKYIEDDTYCLSNYMGDEARVEIPATYCGRPVSTLYDDLFKHHTEINEVIIPEGVTTIGGFVFDGATGIRHIELPKSLTYLWQYAFVRSSIEEIVIPGNCRDVIPFTFQDCKQLKRVICEPGVRRIFGYAFKDCTALEEVIMPESTEIDPKAFLGCPHVGVTRK